MHGVAVGIDVAKDFHWVQAVDRRDSEIAFSGRVDNTGPGGGRYPGPGGGKYSGPGGGLYTGPGGGLYTGPGGGLHTGPGGGLYTGPGGGLYTGPGTPEFPTYQRNIPPMDVFIAELRRRGLHGIANMLAQAHGL